MRFAEVFLRLGSALVGWMVLVAYFLWLAVSGRVGCEASGDDLYRLLLVAGPVAAILSLLTTVTRPMPDIHTILRWIGVLPVLLLPLIVIALWRFGQSVFVAGEAICSAGPPPLWQTLWVPVQATALIVCVVIVARGVTVSRTGDLTP